MSAAPAPLGRSDPADFAAALVTWTERGLYCPAGDFHIDPCRAVQTAVITHAHGDHLRGGCARYLLAAAGESLARHRLGRGSSVTGLEYGVPVSLGGVRVSLHAAGHVLGSSQVRIEHAGCVWVVSGDYKRQPDPTCAPFEELACDVFVSEATFAQPRYRWPPTADVVAQIWDWWRDNRARGIASVLFCYALGKAQRVLAELTAFTDQTVYVHPAIAPLTRLYRKAGIRLLPTLTSAASADYRGSLVLVPPGAAGTPWMRRLGEHSRALCSGWMCEPEQARRRAYDRGFVLSDHADWPALTSTCLATGARRVLLMHGQSSALAEFLRQRGVDAQAIAQPAGVTVPP